MLGTHLSSSVKESARFATLQALCWTSQKSDMLTYSANRQHLLFILGFFYLLNFFFFFFKLCDWSCHLHAYTLYPLCKIQWDVYGICALTFIMDLGHGQAFFFNVNLEYYNKNGAQLLMKTKPHPLTLCDCGLNTSHMNLFRNSSYSLVKHKLVLNRFFISPP